MALPSDEQLLLELHNLSAHLYGGIDREGDLAPTREEWDKWRDRKWSQSRSLLNVFGLSVNRAGWTTLVNSFGFLCPTLGEAKTAANKRRQDNHTYSPYYRDDESYPELVGTSVRVEVYYEDLGEGYYRKVTRTVTSLR